MSHLLIAALAATTVLAGQLAAQQQAERGTLKKIDADQGLVTISVEGEDRVFATTPETRFMGSDGPLEGLGDPTLKPGSPVMFRSERRGERDLLVGLRIGPRAGGAAGKPEAARKRPRAEGNRPNFDSSRLTPLTDMGLEQYEVFEGGLYGGGKNERPEKHEAAGRAIAQSIQPLNDQGEPSPDGSIGLLSIGMSNATQEFSAFKQMAEADPDKNPKVIIVDGAQGGMTAARIANTDSETGQKFWSNVDQRLGQAKLTRKQVQVAWIKQANAQPTEKFPRHVLALRAELEMIVRLMQDRFPNLKLVYLSSRTYGGYAKTPLNPEPYAYESGFAVRWLIEHQLAGDPAVNFDRKKGPVHAAWLSWGPYLWANGTTARSDGLRYEPSDFAEDGTHPSQAGRKKIGELLLRFFKTDSTTRPWFLTPEAQKSEPSETRKDEPRGTEQSMRGRRGRPQDMLFQLLDRNRDAQLSREELASAGDAFDLWDRDGDGLFDEAELVRAATGRRPGEIITPAAKGERYSNTLAAGDAAPDFTLPDPARTRQVTLSSFRGKRPVVLIFGSFT